MRIGIVGSGRIGGNAGRLFVHAGHEVLFSGSGDQAKLEATAREAGAGARTGTPREAVEFGEVVMFAVPWVAVDEVLAAAGPLDGKIVIDTTNQFGRDGWEELGGRTAAQVNAARMPGARYTKSFNTLTAGFQRETAGRSGAERVAFFVCGDDEEAKKVVSDLIESIGFAPVDVGGTADAALMEAPRREGAVYGEEYREPEALAAVEAARAGRPIPPTPVY
jgi:8-hydroxy-5-deazaflavin:NADPH oxidoreductase